jgi:uncharacterized protein
VAPAPSRPARPGHGAGSRCRTRTPPDWSDELPGDTAFPADGYTARWQTWDERSRRDLTLRWENEAWTASGEVGRERVDYVLRLSPTWHVRQFLLFRDLDEPDLWLATDGHGRWGEVNGATGPSSTAATTSTSTARRSRCTLPIRRLPVDVGDDMELPGHARRRGDARRRAGAPPVSPPRPHVAGRADGQRPDRTEFDVDEYGLVLDLPGSFRRR